MSLTAKDIEISVAKYLDLRVNLILPNASWGLGLHECDLLVLTKSGYASEVEIKVSKSDLLRDKEKRHGHESDRIKSLWFAIPESLKEHVEHVPAHAGVLVVREDGSVRKLRKPVPRPKPKKWSESEVLHLAKLIALRMWSLKIKLRRLAQRREVPQPEGT